MRGMVVLRWGTVRAVLGERPGAVERRREARLVGGLVARGQAFGGELGAVTMWTGLLAAREIAAAGVVVVADGGGSLGREARFGVSDRGGGQGLKAAGS